MSTDGLPVAVIGAGPVGLAAAAHLVMAGEEPVVLEAGDTVGASVLQWGHVRLFSPWSYNVDKVAARLLERDGWTPPPANDYPTGSELVTRYLAPLAQVPELAGRIRTGTRVQFVTRAGHDLMKTNGRTEAPFVLRVVDADGEHDIAARAVIDASGTWSRPNPLGGAGIPAVGETGAAGRIVYGIPDVLGTDRPRYGGRRVLVVGSGHSAFNALTDLVALAGADPATRIWWAVRRPTLAPLIDPNVHSCGTVRPHGAEELSHPEAGFYIVGMKSYGRAPTALMLTGYEQVRSVVAALTGDWDAARRVELVLPETGACSWRPPDETVAEPAGGELAGAVATSCCG